MTEQQTEAHYLIYISLQPLAIQNPKLTHAKLVAGRHNMEMCQLLLNEDARPSKEVQDGLASNSVSTLNFVFRSGGRGGRLVLQGPTQCRFVVGLVYG